MLHLHAGRIEDTLFARSPLDKPAIVESTRQLSFPQLTAAVSELAQRLIKAGVQPGDRVAVFLEKSIEACVTFYGIWSAGGVVIPVNETLRSAQIQHILSDCNATLLISSAKQLASLKDQGLGDVPTLEYSISEPIVAKQRPMLKLASQREPAIILYTSGSTGMPKGIVLSHENLVAGTRIVATYLELRETDRLLSVLPFSFDYGLNQLLTSVAVGATLYLQRSLFPADVCRSLQTFEITGMAAVPTLWVQLMQRHSPFSQREFPSLRYLTNSGGAFPVELIQRYRQVCPRTQIFLMYGLSEAFRSTYLPPAELDRRPASMGKAIPETEILVINDEGKECAPNEVGQLVHAGPTVALGYWNRPEATAAVFRPHPFRSSERAVYSGDLVKRDEDGFLYFVGRGDQQLKSYGFRISPEEVEAALHRSELLAEVVVRGVPDEVAGQAIVAHVVAKNPATFAEQALLDFCRQEMPRYMVPKQIVVHESFPRTSSGKVDRKNVG